MQYNLNYLYNSVLPVKTKGSTYVGKKISQATSVTRTGTMETMLKKFFPEMCRDTKIISSKKSVIEALRNQGDFEANPFIALFNADYQ